MASDLQHELVMARATIERLEARVAELEVMVGADLTVPLELGMTATEERIFAVLLARDIASKEGCLAAIVNGRPDSDEPLLKIVDVLICKMRAKLKPYRIQIETVWGRGYRMTAESKQKARAMLAAAA